MGNYVNANGTLNTTLLAQFLFRCSHYALSFQHFDTLLRGVAVSGARQAA